MKKLLFSLIMLPLLLLFGSCVPVARPEPDYREMVIRAAAEGEAEAGREARDFWAAQLRVQRSPLPCPDFDELLLLARLIQTEAGDSRLPEAWRLCVGEVALNRVASPEFPDTLPEVLAQEELLTTRSAPPGPACSRRCGFCRGSGIWSRRWCFSPAAVWAAGSTPRSVTGSWAATISAGASTRSSTFEPFQNDTGCQKLPTAGVAFID